MLNHRLQHKWEKVEEETRRDFIDYDGMGNQGRFVKQKPMVDRDKEKKILADIFLYGIVTIGLAWILMFIIIGINQLITINLWVNFITLQIQ